jgi:hypothetical protein|tara:strand:+ start:2039 stop:2551 length:513 start_codon:yes stop_codon:yes gene_type:complete
MNTIEYPHFMLAAECFGRTLADGGDTILTQPGAKGLTYKAGTLNYNKLPTDPFRPVWGYAVGGLAPEIRICMVEVRNDIAEGYLESKHPQVLFKEFRKAFEETWNRAFRVSTFMKTCVGTWVDGEDIVFDVSQIVHDESTAMRLARERNEKAIYDITDSKEIINPEYTPV